MVSAEAVAFSPAVFALLMSCPLCELGHDRFSGGLLQCNMTYMRQHPLSVKG
jgi:hypothetical protein